MSTTDRKLRVFLCHASEDRAIVRELYQHLIAEGWIEPWLDTARILPGQHWTTVIRESIDSADSVIILISNNSINKEGFVQREMNYVWERSLEKPRGVIFLIPLRLENCDVPYDFRDRQWADFFGEEKEDTFQALLKSLKLRYEQKLYLEIRGLAKKQGEEKTNYDKEELKRKEAEERAKRNAEEKERKDAQNLVFRQDEERKRREKKEREQREAEDIANRKNLKIAREQAMKKTRQVAKVNLIPIDYSINDVIEPKKNNITLIIGVIITILACSCVLVAGLTWQFGDQIMQQLGLY